MNIVVDTSVWSMALRKEPPSYSQHIQTLTSMLSQGRVVLIGIVLQEVLQGIRSQKRFEEIKAHIDALPFLSLGREDYIEAARMWNLCRAKGVQASTTDCLIAAACIQHNCALLTCDKDFEHIARHCELRLL